MMFGMESAEVDLFDKEYKVFGKKLKYFAISYFFPPNIVEVRFCNLSPTD
jgi:hypothetical protein